MRRRRRFLLLVVREDGADVHRLDFPRRLVVAGLVALLLVSAAVGVLAVDWLQLRRITRDARPHVEQLAEQRATLETVHKRIGELQREVAGWRDIHARLFDAFGPDGTPSGRDKGIGGPATPVERVPGHGTPHDELDRLAEGIAEESQNLRIVERLMARAGKLLAALPTRWPVRGPVNSEFGTRVSPWTKAPEFHGGIDIRAERGTPVHAPAGGAVVVAGPYAEYGLTVILEHGNEIRSIYAHLSKIAVGLGQRVERGAQLGLTGNTGRSSGPHLHYEILVKGQAVNPRAYIWD